MISPRETELASYVSWPAFEQVDYQGWIVRFAEGYTKRANSVNVLVPSRGSLPEAVAHCESFYEARQQPAIFRLLSFVDDPPLDLFLAGRGYRFVEPSLVLSCRLNQPSAGFEKLTALDRISWLKNFHELSESEPARQAIHEKILERLPASSLYVVLEDQGRPVACGLGVAHESYFGIFDIVTRRHDRGRGHGAQLVKGMLDWAQRRGALHAYVQVVGHNAAAVRLYEKIGYRRLYHYWYRVRPKSAAGIS